MNQPIINDFYSLEKMLGKGGWTYVVLHNISASLRGTMGMVKVNGFVDDCEIKDYNLFPMKNQPNSYFFPIKAEIRKKIKKEEGDTVKIILYAPQNEVVSDEFLLCLGDDIDAKKFFNTLNSKEQQEYITWVETAKSDDTKVTRIVQALDRLVQGKKFADK